ncbi:MAG: hypothetical protein ABDH59_09650, partial [Fervidobacterium sp.]
EMLEREEDIHSKLLEIINLSVKVKVEVVKNDLRDSNIRKILNFGHTIGHAIELKFNLKHGFAISIGMVLESVIGTLFFDIDKDVGLRIVNLLKKFNLPTFIDLTSHEQEIFEIILHDKKSRDEKIDLVCVRQIGSSELVSIEKSKLLEGLQWIFKRQEGLKSLYAQV